MILGVAVHVSIKGFFELLMAELWWVDDLSCTPPHTQWLGIKLQSYHDPC